MRRRFALHGINSVHNDVQDDLLQMDRIASHEQRFRREHGAQDHCSSCDLRHDDLDDVPHRLVQIERP